jgi:protein-L-isoaspartate(D-aspartate) O-methyltransferase
VGAGTGYYSAILAELVGPEGRVLAFEIDAELAERAADNLEPWPQAEVVAGDGALLDPGPADVIVVNAGWTRRALRVADRHLPLSERPRRRAQRAARRCHAPGCARDPLAAHRSTSPRRELLAAHSRLLSVDRRRQLGFG